MNNPCLLLETKILIFAEIEIHICIYQYMEIRLVSKIHNDVVPSIPDGGVIYHILYSTLRGFLSHVRSYLPRAFFYGRTERDVTCGRMGRSYSSGGAAAASSCHGTGAVYCVRTLGRIRTRRTQRSFDVDGSVSQFECRMSVTVRIIFGNSFE